MAVTTETKDYYRLTFGTALNKTRSLTIRKARTGLDPAVVSQNAGRLVMSQALSGTDAGAVNQLSKARLVRDVTESFDLS